MRWNAQLQSRCRTGSLILIGAACLIHATNIRADDFWKHKPPAEWSRAETLKLLRNSPWAKVELVVFLQRTDMAAFSIPTGTNHCDPDAIDPNGNCTQKNRVEMPVDESRQADAAPQISPSTTFLVVWQSATVGHAFARLHDLGERTIIAFQAEPPRLPADRYVITVKLEQPGRLGSGFAPFAVGPTGLPTLRASLRTEEGAVAPLETEFTGLGANSAVHFFFPRTLNGKPLVRERDKSAEFSLAGRSFALRTRFKIDSAFLQGIGLSSKP